MAKKKQQIDIDDMIEERVEAILAERMAEIEKTTGSNDIPSEDSVERVFCRDCVYWEALAHQEDSSRVNGVCHYVPALPQRKATDWCSKGEKA